MNATFNINGKIIETSRLMLRSFTPDDLDDFYEYASVNGVGEMAGWKHHESKEESKMILDAFIKEDKVFAIVNKSNNKVIGSLGIEMYSTEDVLSELDCYQGRELGFVLSKDYWGKGIIPEAVKAIMNYLFKELDLDFLLCGYFNFNKQSKRAQDKCGFFPYRSILIKTRMGTEEPGTLNLLLNPNKKIALELSHSKL